MTAIMDQSKRRKLDFRFADEMDGMDIVQFVNEAYSVEWNPDSGLMCFRKEGYKVETTEVENDLLSMPTKWLVLETPMPEELIVGAARVKYDAARNGRVDVFCVAGADADTKLSIMKQLLSKVETVCYNIGLRSCIVEAAQWRTDLEELFTSCGYEEASGHIWPEDRQHELTKPTMVLEYHKVFGATSSADAMRGDSGVLVPTTEVELMSDEGVLLGSCDAAGDIVSQLAALNDLAIETTGTNDVASRDGTMPALFESLFAALHAEYGSDPQQASGLVEQECRT